MQMSPELLFIDAHLEMANIFIYFQLSDANNALIRTGWRYGNAHITDNFSYLNIKISKRAENKNLGRNQYVHEK